MRHVEQRLFQSCFPLLHVSMGAISITWSADMIPIEMKMAYKVRLPHPSTGTDGAFHTVVETYKRTFVQAGYELDVSCEKVVVSPNLQHESFFKRQNFFEKNEVWTAGRAVPAVVVGGGRQRRRQQQHHLGFARVPDPWIVSTSLTRPFVPVKKTA